MRRAVSFLLVLILVLSISMPAAFAAGEEFDFNLTVNGETHTTVAPGGTVEVKLIIVRNDGQNYDLWSAQDYIKFDRAYLTLDKSSIKVMTALVDGHETDIFEANGVTFDLGDSDRVYVNHAATEGLAVTPTITVVTFNLIAGMQEGTTRLTHDKPEMKSSTRDFLTVKTNDAIVTIGQIPTTYTIQASAGIGGTISPSGAVSVQKGGNQSFAITPDSGYTISDVTVDGVTVGAVSSYTFSGVAANHSIAAVFKKNASSPIGGGGSNGGGTSYTITANAGDGGSITPNGKVSVSQNASKTFTITPASGYRVSDVLVDGKSVGAVTSYIFEKVTDNHTISVEFAKRESVADPTATGVAGWLVADDHIVYLHGYSDGNFGPNDNMTRAQAAQMFYNLLKNKNVATTANFSDIPDGAWYETATNTLSALGVMTGIGNNKFDPDRSITRAEFTVVAMRFAKLDTSGENYFTDVSESNWFYAQVKGAIKYGWIGGYSDNTFRPYATITRAEVTTIVNRMLGRSADETYVDAHTDSLKLFPDVPKSYWAYYNICEATNAHDYTKTDSIESWSVMK